MVNLQFPCVEQLAPNFTRLTFGSVVCWYSYGTPIAFRYGDRPLVVRQNQWGPTPGKHLSVVDGGAPVAKKARVDEDTFNTRWAMMADMIVEQGVNLLA